MTQFLVVTMGKIRHGGDNDNKERGDGLLIGIHYSSQDGARRGSYSRSNPEQGFQKRLKSSRRRSTSAASYRWGKSRWTARQAEMAKL